MAPWLLFVTSCHGMHRLLIDCTRLSSGGGRTIGENLVATLVAGPPQNLEICSLVPASYECARERSHLVARHEIREVAFRSAMSTFVFYSRTVPRLLAKSDLFLGMSNIGVKIARSRKRRVVYFHQPWALYDVRNDIVARLTVRERLSLRLLKSHLGNWREYMDAVIVQSDVMKGRLVDRYSVPAELVSVIPPPIASSAAADTPLPDLERRLRGRIGVAYVSAYYAHKNFEVLPRAARVLKDRGLTRFVFVLTLSGEELRGRARPFSRAMHDLDVAEYFEIVGRIPSSTVATVVKRCGLALNVAEIESFTGSILDTAAAGVPLVCSDRDFFTTLCGSGFYVCEPSDPGSIVSAVELAANNLDSPLRVRAGILDLVPSYPVFAERIMDVVTAGL